MHAKIDNDGNVANASDGYITLTQATKLLRGARGKSPHVHTIGRWIRRGVKTREGILRLQGTLVGHEWLTRPEWVREFERRRRAEGSNLLQPPRRRRG
jgi:hypothetical protein